MQERARRVFLSRLWHEQTTAECGYGGGWVWMVPPKYLWNYSEPRDEWNVKKYPLWKLYNYYSNICPLIVLQNRSGSLWIDAWFNASKRWWNLEYQKDVSNQLLWQNKMKRVDLNYIGLWKIAVAISYILADVDMAGFTLRYRRCCFFCLCFSDDVGFPARGLKTGESKNALTDRHGLEYGGKIWERSISSVFCWVWLNGLSGVGVCLT